MDFKKRQLSLFSFFLWLGPYIFGMKYYNKTRTIEQKVIDREILELLRKQNDLLKSILEQVTKN